MVEHLNEYDTMPTIRKIGTHFNFKSTNAAYGHIQLIVKKGHLEYISRGYRLPRTTNDNQ